MTEREALQKQCCGGEGCGGFNEKPYPARWCTGSMCMAWRVAHIEGHQENAYNRPEPPEGDGWKAHSRRPGNLAWWRTVEARDIGYCGLAGRPGD